MKYELTKDLLSGNKQIDREHEKLFDAVNALMAACAKGEGRRAMEPAIVFLTNYVDTHFRREEALQKRSGYPEWEEHKAFHGAYRRRLQAIMDQIPEAGPGMIDLSEINGHVARLIRHIREEDRPLGAYLNDVEAGRIPAGQERKKIS